MPLNASILNENPTGFELIFQHATIGIIVVDMNGIVVRANPYAEKLFGYAPATMIRQALNVLIPGDVRKVHSANVSSYFASPVTRPMGSGLDLFALKNNGAKFPVEISLSAFESEGETFALAFIKDVSVEKNSSKKFTTIFNESPVPILLTEADSGKILDVNESFCALMKRSKAEMIGVNTLDVGFFINEKERDRFCGLMASQGKLSNYELKINSGKSLYLSVYAETILIDGKSCHLKTCINITESKKLKEKLLADEQRTRLLVQHAPVAIAMLDADMRYIMVSNRWLSDYHLEDNITGLRYDQVSTNFPEAWAPSMRHCLKGETIHAADDYFIRYDGAVEWVRWELCPWRSATNTIGGVVIFSEIITKEKNYVAALKASQSKLAAEAEALAQLNEAGNHLWAQESLEGGLKEMLGYANDLFGTDMANVQLADLHKKKLYMKASTGYSEEFVEQFKVVEAGDGSICGRGFDEKKQITVEDVEKDKNLIAHLDVTRKAGIQAVQCTPIFDKAGMPIGMITTHGRKPTSFNQLDLQKMELYAQKAAGFLEHFQTLEILKRSNAELETKVAERTNELTQLLKREKELNEMKSRFVSLASHEFRTPLSVILSSAGLLELFEKNGDSVRKAKHISRIKSSVKSLIDILENFLSLDKLSQDKVQLKKTTFDLKEFCEELIDDLSDVLKNGQIIHYDHNGENNIYHDPKLLRGILINLLSNASKYSQEAQPIYFSTTISASLLAVIIKDQGIGIPLDEQKSLFERFYRAKNADGFKGTGLGLSIVKKYIELLHGTISFVSAPENGTEFTVTVPLSYEISDDN